MRKYSVSYAGLPSSERSVSAASPKLAALTFFSKNPCRNPIIVGTSWLTEETFTCEEMVKDIDGVSIEDIPLKIRTKDPPRKIGLIEDFMNHAILGEFHSWK